MSRELKRKDAQVTIIELYNVHSVSLYQFQNLSLAKVLIQ